MFLHIGNGFIVPIKQIIAILDVETVNTSKITHEFINAAKEEEFIRQYCDNPKSYVIIDEKKSYVVYMSSISTETLYNRANKYLKKMID